MLMLLSTRFFIVARRRGATTWGAEQRVVMIEDDDILLHQSHSAVEAGGGKGKARGKEEKQSTDEIVEHIRGQIEKNCKKKIASTILLFSSVRLYAS